MLRMFERSQPRELNPGRSNILAVDHLARSFGGLVAVRDASFEVAPIGITGLIGPNGAGKSTAINVISGSIKPTGGRVVFDGEDVTGQPAHRIARRGLIRTFQKANIFSRLTVMENLLTALPHCKGDRLGAALMGARYWRCEERAAVERARLMLERFKMGMYEDTYAGDLSGGEKRLVELMRALFTEPRLLVLDEPLAGINPVRAREIGGHLTALAEEGLPMLLVEHEMAFVERLCSRVVVLAQGRVLAVGSMSELRKNREVVDAYLA